MMDDKESRTFVSAFARGLSLIQAFGPEAKRMTVAEAAARSHLDRAVARRLLLTLVSLGFARTDGRAFELTPNILTLGFSYLSAAGLDFRLKPLLDELSQMIGENASVTVLQGSDVVYIARSEAAGRQVSLNTVIGSRIPALPNASGRILLSTLDDKDLEKALAGMPLKTFTSRTCTDPAELLRIIRKARTNGYAIIDQEFEDGLISASVLLRSRNGQPLAALNLSSHTGRMTPRQLVDRVVPVLRDFAQQMSLLLI